MAEVNASMVKKLRIETGAGFSSCKQALAENDGDMDKAHEWLKLRGAALAEKKSDRTASEGAITIAEGDSFAVLVEVFAETDFVVNNEKFIAFSQAVAKAVVANESSIKANELDATELATLPCEKGTVEDLRNDATLTTGENIQIGKAVILRTTAGSDGKIHSYIHHNKKIGVIAEFEGSAAEVGKDVCMQIAAMRPDVISAKDFEETYLTKVKEMFAEELIESKKPDQVKQKIIAGKLSKHLSERALLEQSFIKDDKLTVEQHLSKIGAKIVSFKATYI